MTRLIQKDLERGFAQDGPTMKMGIPIVINSPSRSIRPMYIEGFGALFMIKVNFPLIGSGPKERKKPEMTASDWDNAKRELSSEQPDPIETVVPANDTDFDAGRVDHLKSALLEGLKNASNIRHLKPEEFVGLTIFGAPAFMVERSRSGKSAQLREAALAARQGTVLSIRVRKSDVDAFARQKLSFDEFQRQATVGTYAGPGYATQSLNSWIQSRYGSGASK